jgi:hypothetical protein
MMQKYNLGLNKPALTDDGSDDLMNIVNSNKNQPDDSEDYSSMSREDAQSGRAGGITKEQLDQLHKHEAANMWTSLFMNMIGSANGIKDGAKFAEPIGKRVEQERQGLKMQQDLANQQFDRAGAEQKLGLGDINLSNAKRQQGFSTQPLNTIQKATLYSLAKQGKLKNIDPNDIESATQAQYESLISPVKESADFGLKQQQNQNLTDIKRAQLQNQSQANQIRATEKIPVRLPDGSIGYEYANKLTNEGKPLENTIVPQNLKVNQQASRDFVKALKPETVQAHEAIQNYDTALEGLKPQEAQQADDLARRQISAIAGKFDQGSKPNSVTSLNQFLNSIFKMSQTAEFNTPDNPAVGQAAFRRVKSALEFAALTQAEKARSTNFQTQFSLGNSFGANVAGTGVPQEKISELRNELSQRIGGNLQQAISSASNPEVAKEKAKELFEDKVDDYLHSFHNIHGPGYKEDNEMNKPKKSLGHGIISADDYLNSLGK